jgi:macrolide transport system ATP-binding/permease protein
MIESLLIDVRDAVRGMRRNPLFASGVAGTIGVGLGFLCSAFTVINGYLLKPFEIRDPHAIYELSWDSSNVRRHAFSIDEIQALRADLSVFSDVLGFSMFQITHDDAPLWGQVVTGNYFTALGIDPFLGRFLREDDAARPGERPVVVLAHETWTARFGADPSIIGRELRMGRGQYTVIGVAQQGFNGFDEAPIGFWVPVTMAEDFPTRNPYGPERPHMLLALARLKDDITPQAATAWFDVWVRQRMSALPVEDRPTLARVESRATRIPLTGRTLTLFSSILVAFALVLLIACANVANMMLARGVGRQREIAVRLSLGAKRSRIVRQLFVESVLLAGPAALVALGLVWATSRVVPALILNTWPSGLPPVRGMLAPMEPDIRVSVFLVLGAVAAAVFFGLLPAMHTSRTSLTRATRGEFGEGVRASRLRNGLVIAQVAACAVFLVIALGVLGELRRITDVDTRLDIDYVGDLRVPNEHRAAVAERLLRDPRVEGIAITWRPPLYGPLRNVLVTPAGSAEVITAGFTVVSPEFFDLFKLPLVRGRLFTRAEAMARADVAIISEATAARFWPDRDALGQEIALDQGNRNLPGTRGLGHTQVRVIGIARDAINGSLAAGFDPTCIYFPTHITAPDGVAMLVRARTDMRELRAAVADVTAAVREDAAFPIYPMRSIVGVQIWALQAFSSVVMLLGVIALVLAISGTYGVIAYLVMQRTREFGIRMALGASAAGIMRAVVRGALVLSAIGAAIGSALALGLFAVFAAVIEILPMFGVAPFVLATAVVLLATALAASVPSLRAARIDPAAALRAE